MTTLYTTGYQRKPLSTFVTQLRDAGVDAGIDIRLRNTSHLAGYTKKDTLAFLLTQGFSIAYEHHPELAPSDEAFDAYKKAKELTWTEFRAQFRVLLEQRHAEEIGRDILARYAAPCLLCAEPRDQHCHRQVVAAYWASHIPDPEIIHL